LTLKDDHNRPDFAPSCRIRADLQRVPATFAQAPDLDNGKIRTLHLHPAGPHEARLIKERRSFFYVTKD
jgi:hypothetical protein